MKHFEQTYKFKAPAEKVWQALVDSKVIDAWGGGPAKMNDKAGRDFSLWGGDIFGINTKVIKLKLLEQDWYSGEKWPEPSKVTFSLHANGDTTTVKLTHANIPDDAAKDIEQGWKDYYFGPIKELLEQ